MVGQIADECAIHSLYNCKGSSGIKPCLLCNNVFAAREVRNIVEADVSGKSVHHTEHDLSKLKPVTSGWLDAIVRRLTNGRAQLNKGDFKELQTRLGWNYDSQLSYRLRLAPPHKYVCFDWMHTLFVNGVFNVHVGCLMWALRPPRKQDGFTYARLHAYSQQWKWPGRMSKVAKDVFCPKRAQSSWEAGRLKCSASEGLCMLPVYQMASPILPSLQCVQKRERSFKDGFPVCEHTYRYDRKLAGPCTHGVCMNLSADKLMHTCAVDNLGYHCLDTLAAAGCEDWLVI